MSGSIVVVGSSNTDMILQMDHAPRPGETVLGGNFSMAAGGKGANQAVAAARAGGEVTFIARVGLDMFGEQALEGFIKDNIDIRYIIRDAQAPSGVALIFVETGGENAIGVASGANSKLSSADVEKAAETITSADVLVIQLETPIDTVKTAVRIASAKSVKVILNPAPAQPLEDDILRHVSILTPNESEAELLTGIRVKDKQSAGRAAHLLHTQGVETVIFTLGSRGVFVVSGDRTTLVPGFEVNVVDTTAAGDTFNGALAVAIAEKKPLSEAIRFANAAAALSVTKLGAQISAPIRQKIDALMDIRRGRMDIVSED